MAEPRITNPRHKPSPDRIIDAHVHVWTYASPSMEWIKDRPRPWDVIRRDIPWEELRAELDAAGVAESILVQACPSPEETHILLDVADREPSVLGVVGWVDMSSLQATQHQLAAFDARGSTKLVGIRASNGWQPDIELLSNPAIFDSCALVAERGLALDLFVRDYTELYLVSRIARRVPAGLYIVNHLGRPPLDRTDAFHSWADAMSELSELPNTVVKYSGWTTFAGRAIAADVRPYISHVLTRFGSSRVLYASNWPVAMVVANYTTTYDATLEAIDGVSGAELDDIMYATAARCYLGASCKGGDQRW